MYVYIGTICFDLYCSYIICDRNGKSDLNSRVFGQIVNHEPDKFQIMSMFYIVRYIFLNFNNFFESP